MNRGNIKSVHLVDEIIEDILLRLPVKSLLRFRCVSKSWLSLISSKRFIKTHLRKSEKNRAFSHHKLIFQRQLVLNECSLHQLLNEPSSIEDSPIYDPANNEVMEGLVMGYCNGLVCLFNKSRNFSLWNPATRISMELPQSNEIYDFDGPTKVGFAWDETSGAYKVFASDHEGWEVSKASVYSSKTNSWKRVEPAGITPYDGKYDRIAATDRIGVFACGKFHWHSDGADYIECFDLESEEFARVELPLIKPPNCCLRQYTLAEMGGCLHLLGVHAQDHDHSDDDDDGGGGGGGGGGGSSVGDGDQSYGVVWVMKESRWLKLFTLALPFEPRHLIHPLFGGGPNGEIVLVFYDNYLIYLPKDKKDGVVLHAGESRIGYFQGCIYVESLVSPNFTTVMS